MADIVCHRVRFWWNILSQYAKIEPASEAKAQGDAIRRVGEEPHETGLGTQYADGQYISFSEFSSLLYYFRQDLPSSNAFNNHAISSFTSSNNSSNESAVLLHSYTFKKCCERTGGSYERRTRRLPFLQGKGQFAKAQNRPLCLSWVSPFSRLGNSKIVALIIAQYVALK